MANTVKDYGNNCSGVTRKDSDTLSMLSHSSAHGSNLFPQKVMQDAVLTEIDSTVI